MLIKNYAELHEITISELNNDPDALVKAGLCELHSPALTYAIPVTS